MKNRLILQTAFGFVLLAIVFSIALSAQSGGVYVKGIITSRSGRPLTSVWVIVSQDSNEKGRSLTGDDGKYYISNLSEGIYKLTVYMNDRQMYEGQVNLPGESSHNVLIK